MDRVGQQCDRMGGQSLEDLGGDEGGVQGRADREGAPEGSRGVMMPAGSVRVPAMIMGLVRVSAMPVAMVVTRQ